MGIDIQSLRYISGDSFDERRKTCSRRQVNLHNKAYMLYIPFHRDDSICRQQSFYRLEHLYPH